MLLESWINFLICFYSKNLEIDNFVSVHMFLRIFFSDFFIIFRDPFNVVGIIWEKYHYNVVRNTGSTMQKYTPFDRS